MASFLNRLDAQLDQLFKGWNYLSTVIAVALALYLLYPYIFSPEPDTHPLLLARQAHPSPVRQPRESAVYRSLEVPHGYPLKTGLNVKEPGAPRWASGRNGDVRDIWRRAVAGPLSASGQATGGRGKIITIRGTEKAVTHELDTVTKALNAVGSYLNEKSVKRAGIYLPNSKEFLTTIFAGSFYGFETVLIPFGKPNEVVRDILKRSEPDFLIAAAGSLPLEDVFEQCPKLKGVIWVVEAGGLSVDWNDPKQGVSTWHDLVEQKAENVSSDLPASSQDESLPGIMTVWLGSDQMPEIVTYSQMNIISAVAAQMSALPVRQRMSSSDLLLPTEALTIPFVLIETLAALCSCASVALNAVAGTDVDIDVVARRLSPTVIVSSSAQAYRLHDVTKRAITGAAKRYALSVQTEALKSGVMPSLTLLNRINPPVSATIGVTAGKLRLIYVFDATHTDSPPITSARLSDLRALTGARVIHALTNAEVAGSVAQTNFYDYRREQDDQTPAHFGVPPSCIELQVVDKGDFKTVEGDDARIQGEITVRGPAVREKEARLGVFGEIRDDGCLNYLFQHPEN